MSATLKAPATTKKAAVVTVNDFLATLPVAPTKKAEAITEPGHTDGESTHPTAKAEDHVQTAPEGEQSKENSKQVKEQVGPASVDSTKEGSVSKRAAKQLLTLRGKAADSVAEPGTEGTAADDQLQIGTKKTPTGEDPKVETASATSGYPDPGTSHPAATDNNSLNGGKYASFTPADFEKMSADESIEAFNKLAEDYFVGVDRELNQPATPASASVPATSSAALHAKAGAAVADAVIDNQLTDRQAYELAQSKVASWYGHGVYLANLVADYMQERAAKKLANEMGGGGPPEMPPEGGGEEEPPPEMSGGGAEAALASLSPEQLAEILQQLGISPEELEGAAGGGGGMGGGGEMPPPPMPPGGGGGGMPVMASVRSERRKKANLQKAVGTITEIMRRSAK